MIRRAVLELAVIALVACVMLAIGRGVGLLFMETMR